MQSGFESSLVLDQLIAQIDGVDKTVGYDTMKP
jgi:hypothetical protein